MNKRWATRGAVIALAALALWGWSATRPTPVYGIKETRLPNGMRVVVIENHRVPAVTHMVWYKTGAMDEKKGEEGVAHYLEHLMFKGTKTVPDGELSKRVARWGGNDNAFTSHDYTAYFQTVPKAHLHDVMAMEADRMDNLSPAAKAAATELQVVRSERRERTENDPSAKLSEQVDAALYGAHPYARPIIGYAGQIESLTLKTAMGYKAAHYAPNNAIVVISGDTTTKEVEAALKDTYMKLKAREIAPRAIPAETQPQAGVIRIADKSVRQPSVERVVRVPSYTQNPKTALALSILEDVLSSSTGRLYQELVVKQKLAGSVYAAYDPFALGGGTFSVSADPASGVAPEQLQSAMDKIVADIAAQGITEDDRARSLQRMEDASVFARDSLSGPAMNVGFALVSGVPARVIDYWPQELAKVTGAQVNEAAKLLETPAVWGILEGTK